MGKYHYAIQIKAPKKTVWGVMLDGETYRAWTNVFQEGSYYEGSWDEGSNIRFLAADDNGALSGMANKVVKNTPYEYILMEVVGEIVDGELDTTSEGSRLWIGGHESYRFTEQAGVTTLEVELEGGEDEEMMEMLAEAWPQALAKLKELAEARAS